MADVEDEVTLGPEPGGGCGHLRKRRREGHRTFQAPIKKTGAFIGHMRQGAELHAIAEGIDIQRQQLRRTAQTGLPG